MNTTNLMHRRREVQGQEEVRKGPAGPSQGRLPVFQEVQEEVDKVKQHKVKQL